ncbi:pseudouridine synthase [Oerskovia douganii]|uniref:pseudouridine synthase n=1 Tax=Oerskovia douganii TaxID=2762210 RepID=UPI002AAF30ED|nr:pseudouridine synthase [Oerskovia douganii]
MPTSAPHVPPRRRRIPFQPLPVRDGLNATRVVLPENGDGSEGSPRWETVLDHLVHRFPDDEARLREKVAAGEVVDHLGRPVDAGTPFVRHARVFLYRDPPVETRVPFEIEILHQDDDLLVVDKPHFLASIPRGAFIAESALVRLRRDLDLPELSPAHRLDRVTAGVLVLTVRPEVRGPYQTLFAERRVTKVYEAVAGVDPGLGLPRVVRSRIHKERGVMRAFEVPGEPNSESLVELVATREAAPGARDGAGPSGQLGLYRLTPHTGKTHQLRLHMNSLGLPILHDNFYPTFYDVRPDDFSRPLQLVSRSIEFVDPLSGRPRRFETTRPLQEWT